MIENFVFETTSGASVTLDPSTVNGQRFSDGNQNIEVCCKNLGGGSYSVFYRFPSGANWIAHVENATENDSVTIVGKQAPICEAVQVRFANVPNGTTSKVFLTTWERGL